MHIFSNELFARLIISLNPVLTGERERLSEWIYYAHHFRVSGTDIYQSVCLSVRYSITFPSKPNFSAIFASPIARVLLHRIALFLLRPTSTEYVLKGLRLWWIHMRNIYMVNKNIIQHKKSPCFSVCFHVEFIIESEIIFIIHCVHPGSACYSKASEGLTSR